MAHTAVKYTKHAMLVLQVLRCAIALAPELVKTEIMAAVTKTCSSDTYLQKLVDLPQDLLVRWLESLASTIDLRKADLSIEAMSRLLSSIAFMDHQCLQELHVPLLGFKTVTDFIRQPQLTELEVATYPANVAHIRSFWRQKPVSLPS